MPEATKGVCAMVAACVIWGLSPLYYKHLTEVPPLEILAHRTLWSVILFSLVLLIQGRINVLRNAITDHFSRYRIGLAALLISCNWFFFIWAVQSGKGIEAALGYYIFPLISVLFGVVFFGERLGGVQRAAVTLAALAVAILTAGLGVMPWIALVLSLSFGFYGLVKKGFSIGPVVSVTGEVLILAPVALIVLGVFHGRGGGAFGSSAGLSAWLAASGLITALPLILFSYASRRVTMATVGLVQYLNPTLQFLVATVVFLEPFSFWHAIAFAMIWTALAVFTAASWRQGRAARRAAGI